MDQIEASHTGIVVHASIIALKGIKSTNNDNFRDILFHIVYSRTFRPPQQYLVLKSQKNDRYVTDRYRQIDR